MAITPIISGIVLYRLGSARGEPDIGRGEPPEPYPNQAIVSTPPGRANGAPVT